MTARPTTFEPEGLRPAMEALCRAGMPGVIAAVVENGRSWRGSAGLADTATRTPMRPDMHHRVGSIAKTFTAVSLLRMVEQGHVDLDTAIGHYLPALVPGERGRRVTVRMLANHTSGLAEYLPTIYPSLRAFPDLTRTDPSSLEEKRFARFDRRDLIAAGLAAPATGAPGSAPGAYSNTNYLLLAELIEHISGTVAEEHIRADVINPLGLSSTYFPDGAGLDTPHTSLYESWFSMFDPPRDFTEVDMSWTGPAASLVSTVDDLNDFFAALLGGRLLRPDSLAQMQRTVPVISFEGAVIDYGLGLHRRTGVDGTAFWGHDGSVWGGGAIVMTRADLGRQMAVLTNRQRWNDLDEVGRPVPHPIDEALARVHGLALGEL